MNGLKALEIRPLIVFNWSFPSNTILSCFFFFFFIVDLYFLIPAVIAQIFIPIAKHVIPTGTQINEAKVVLHVSLTRQHFLNKYYKCLKRKIKTPQLTFIKTNQPKIHN